MNNKSFKILFIAVIVVFFCFVQISGSGMADDFADDGGGVDTDLPEIPEVKPLEWNSMEPEDESFDTDAVRVIGARKLRPVKRLPIHMSITVSGGVSLGAYQAGYLYYLTEITKRNPNLVKVQLLTGASAGTINALLALMALGIEKEQDPTTTLFYKLWTEIHYHDLLDVKRAPQSALSSGAVLRGLAGQIEQRWQNGLDENLDIVMGASTTRIKSHSVEVKKNFEVPRQEEKFVFRVQGRGPDRAPRVSNYVDRAYGVEQPLLPFRDPLIDPVAADEANFNIIRQIIFASSAFPLAFPAQRIDFCMTDPNLRALENIQVLKECPEAKYHELFVDGGVFDRNPLRLAYRIAASGLIKDETLDELKWLEMPDLSDKEIKGDFQFLYLDQGSTSYPQGDDEEEEKIPISGFSLFLEETVKSTQGKELYSLIDEHPDVRRRMDLTTRDFPTASGQMLNFFGFFDRKFRQYDFFLGMHDARNYAIRRVIPTLARRAAKRGIKFVFPEDDMGADGADSWTRFFCMRAVFDGEEKYLDSCEGDQFKDFRILMQVSIDRLYDHCANLPFDPTIEHEHCGRAMDEKPPVRVPHVKGDDDWWKRRRADSENEFAHTIRLLESYNFHFKDLGLDREDASMAMSAIREIILGYGDAFAKKQPVGPRLALRVLGKPAVNFFMYAPPETILYAQVGNIQELGWSSAKISPISHWLRFNLSLQVKGFSTLLTEEVAVMAFTPMLGYEFEPVPISGPLFQLRLGLRAGYQFSTRDKFMTKTCKDSDFQSDSLYCSAPVGQAFLAVSFYERIRIQAGVEWLPKWLPPMKKTAKHLWSGFVSIGWQWLSPF